MKAGTWMRRLVALVATVVLAGSGLAGCKSRSEPVVPDPEPVVVTTPAAAVVPSALEEVEDGLTPAEQQALASTLAAEAAAEITAENVAAAVAALEAELDQETGQD